jgi:hypothetical protein
LRQRKYRIDAVRALTASYIRCRRSPEYQFDSSCWRRYKGASLFFGDLLDAKVREFKPRYAEEKGTLLGQFRRFHTDIYGSGITHWLTSAATATSINCPTAEQRGIFCLSNERNESADYAVLPLIRLLRLKASSELHPDVAVNQAREAAIKALVEA